MHFTLLQPHDPEPFQDFASIVHLGAGPYFEPDDYDFPKLKKVILIDADAEACSELRMETAGNSLFEVHQKFLHTQEGFQSFYKYNLSQINGSLDIQIDSLRYPSLQKLLVSELETEKISKFAEKWQTLPKPCLWIYSLPFSDFSLLHELVESVEYIEWILLRKSFFHLNTLADYAKDTKSLLLQYGFEPYAKEIDSSGNRTGLLFKQNQQIFSLQKEIRGYKSKLEKLNVEWQDELEQLKRQLAEAIALKQFYEGNLKEADSCRKSLEANLQEHEAKIQVLEKERQEQANLAAEQQKKIEELQQQLRDRDASLAELDTLHQLVQDEKARAEAQISIIKQEAESRTHSLQANLQEHEAKMQVLEKELQERANLAAEQQKKIDELQQQLRERDATLAELNTRQQLMQEEITRAEAQIDIIKELLLRDEKTTLDAIN